MRKRNYVLRIFNAKRAISLLTLVSVIVAIPFTTFAASINDSYDAKEAKVERSTTEWQSSTLNPRDYGTKYEAQNVVEAKSVGTKLIKKAIKIVLKNHKKAVPIIEELGGKRAAKAFSKHFNKVSPQLKALLKWSDIPYQAVHDAVYRGLINAGVSRATATKAAHALKEGISWLL